MTIINANKYAFDGLLNWEKITLVDFWAPWCGPCKMLAPVLEEIAENYKSENRVQIVKVNVDEEPDLAIKYKVQGIPTVILLKGKKEIERIVGVSSSDVYKEKIDKLR